MQQFIPFEDDWDALEQLRPEALIPYRVGLVQAHEPVRQAGASFDAQKSNVAAAIPLGCVPTSPGSSGT